MLHLNSKRQKNSATRHLNVKKGIEALQHLSRDPPNRDQKPVADHLSKEGGLAFVESQNVVNVVSKTWGDPNGLDRSTLSEQ